ncbi:MAG: hypothetical protein HY340_03875 [Candidatus Kerfeldbacteria bacterium]|nr:hypothetical protein [Candidatus Kerfeldbacteria bacterium]
MQLKIVIAVVLIAAAASVVFFVTRPAPAPAVNEPVAVTNVNTAPAENVNADNSSSVLTNTESTIIGAVFVKSYRTPSESYGILGGGGKEIGLEDYDSRIEEFREYVGDRVSVIFSRICRSNQNNCCRSVFDYCGYIKSWEPVQK